ncbi:MAG: hypothetical protein U0269_14160 [Polyangiales bacterium]
MAKHLYSTGLVFLTAIAIAQRASAQSATRDELQCALLGAERAGQCLRAVAERSSDGDVERAAGLLAQTGDLSRAEALVERAFSQGERRGVWPAMLTIGRARIERRQARAALDWYERWRDRAKRESTADVLAAVHTGIGHALLASDERDRTRRAYEAYRLAVHVWRAEHAYKLSADGSVLNEYEGERGYVAPALRSFSELASAVRSVRERVDEFAIDDCVESQWNHGDALRRCLRALRPPPPPPVSSRFEGLTESGIDDYVPFGALTQPDAERQRSRAHPTRSHLSTEAFDRGNTTSAEALFGMLRIQHDAYTSESTPPYNGGTTRAAFERWTRSTLAPFFTSGRWILAFALTPLAQQAMATNVPDAELGAAQQLAHAQHQFALRIREAPVPPDWVRSGEPYETLRDEW